jgi:hypothetical protein
MSVDEKEFAGLQQLQLNERLCALSEALNHVTGWVVIALIPGILSYTLWLMPEWLRPGFNHLFGTSSVVFYLVAFVFSPVCAYKLSRAIGNKTVWVWSLISLYFEAKSILKKQSVTVGLKAVSRYKINSLRAAIRASRKRLLELEQ